MWSLLLACAPPPSADSDVVPSELQFSFAILADPHITADPDREARLVDAVAWIDDHAEERQIALVWVVGDIGWGDGLPLAAARLGDLDVPWLPVLGDNEVHFGDEQRFDEVFAPQYDALATTLPGWSRGAVEVTDPFDGQQRWFQNFSFDFGGLRWIGLDWCSRDPDALLSEFGQLHDFEGGTLPYLDARLGGLEANDAEDVLLFSHHPMHLGVFDLDEMAAITAITGPVAGRVAAAFAGHTHVDAEVDVPEGGYTAWVTDAVWDDVNTVRVVEVWSDGEHTSYVQDLEIVP